MQINQLIEILNKYSVIVSTKQAEQLLKLMEITLDQNKVMNLTAIKDEDEFLEKMIIDSAIVFKPGDLDNLNLLDVGSGAGFPGLVLAILYPSCSVTCLDSTAKKVNHIIATANKLGLENVTGVADRAENYAKKNRETFDVVISRAVASLDILVELCGAFVRVNGQMVAMKSVKADQELKDAANAIKVMGLHTYKVETTTLPFNGDSRYNIFLYKKKSCLKKYPRIYKDIKARPL